MMIKKETSISKFQVGEHSWDIYGSFSIDGIKCIAKHTQRISRQEEV